MKNLNDFILKDEKATDLNGKDKSRFDKVSSLKKKIKKYEPQYNKDGIWVETEEEIKNWKKI